MISHKPKDSNKEVYCNCCGSKITNIDDNVTKKDYLHIDKKWGYFSESDMERHTFDICEDCYKKWISTFDISVESAGISEFVGDEVHIYTECEIEKLNNAYRLEMNINNMK